MFNHDVQKDEAVDATCIVQIVYKQIPCAYGYISLVHLSRPIDQKSLHYAHEAQAIVRKPLVEVLNVGKLRRGARHEKI